MPRLFLLLAVFIGFSLNAEQAPDLPPDQPPEKIGPENPTAGDTGKIIDVTIKGVISERINMPSMFGNNESATDLYELFTLFQRVKQDESVKGILLRISPVGAGWAKCQEIREMIKEVRKAGKKVWVWLPLGTNKEYFLASAADEIIMPPAGFLLTMGLRAEVTFMKGLFDKIGVEAEIIHVGDYKAAGEPFTRNEMSPESREAMEQLIDDILNSYVDGVCSDTELKPAQFRKLLDGGPYHADTAKKAGLIQTVAYLDDFLTDLEKKDKMKVVSKSDYMGDAFERPDFSTIGGMMRFMTQISQPPGTSSSPHPKLGIVYAVGPIVSSAAGGMFGGDEVITAEPVARALEKLRDDKTVKAVVLRVDSPGGDVVTSDLIWREVQKTDKVKPVIVSMSDVAASGGYYISMPARAIVAHSASITGSIGVIGGKFNLTKLYELVGAHVDVIERGEGSGLFSAHHKLSEEERARMYALLKQTYDLFLSKVSEGRNKPVADVDKVAQGRVWTGMRARKLGLIDETGGLMHALNLAKKHAGIKQETKLELMVYPRKKTIFDMFGAKFEETRAPSLSSLLPARLAPSIMQTVKIAFELAERQFLIHMPYAIDVK
ncbi:MAG: signal peptide peptidase SppA [Planctomycetota bacterium]|nr:signal peptide peptidase SppA [Planctomycetota bacterium]MDA1139570.1 signal peptide peptidase SppA [Planctomycetota bacterium]